MTSERIAEIDKILEGGGYGTAWTATTKACYPDRFREIANEVGIDHEELSQWVKATKLQALESIDRDVDNMSMENLERDLVDDGEGGRIDRPIEIVKRKE